VKRFERKLLMPNVTRFALWLALVTAIASPRSSEAAPCEGRCADGYGAVMSIDAGSCDDATEVCHAGCDSSASGRPRPYAECRSRVSGVATPRGTTVQTDNRRERQDGGGTITE
jgi:hypothetical protein